MLYCTVLYYSILYYTILYYTILYYTILYYTILYYTILYYTILYYTILYYTILYYTILYYTILYYTILYYILATSKQSWTSVETTITWTPKLCKVMVQNHQQQPKRPLFYIHLGSLQATATTRSSDAELKPLRSAFGSLATGLRKLESGCAGPPDPI